MLRRIALFLVLFAPFGLAALAGPVAVLYDANRVDGNGIYLAVSSEPQHALQGLAQMGLKPIGPELSRFAVFIEAVPEQREAARAAGFYLIAASSLAAICGVGSKDLNV